MSKLRLDTAMVERELVKSRSQAQQLIDDKCVEICDAGQWMPAVKPSQKIQEYQEIRVTNARVIQYASRAGLKLEKALAIASLDLNGLIALDIGQSTGGFTDCLLKHNIEKVVGVDVGRDQLSEELRNHKRVTCFEGVNARELPVNLLTAHAPAGFDLCVMDVSFISQTLIIPGLYNVLKANGIFISLVKPQFEVGKDGIGKGGIVKSPELFKDVENKVWKCLEENGFSIDHYIESPITGSDGNREFLVIAKFNKNCD